MMNGPVLSRRALLKSAAAAAAVTWGRVVPGGVAAADARTVTGVASRLLLDRWEYYRGSLGGIWEVWRGDKASDNVPWQGVTIPHCVNALDALDPDIKYYQGPAWYRTTVPAPPLAPGTRTLLAGWYRGRYTEYRSSIEQEMKRVRHFFHAEWGGDSHAGRHSEDPDRLLSRVATGQGTDERGLDYLLNGGQSRASRDGDWSESYICNLFDWHLKEQETMPSLTGTAQWIFKDFSTPLRAENPIPRMNQKGLVERDLTPKEGYYVFQSYWAARPMVHIYGHSWPVRWGDRDERKLMKVYSNCASWAARAWSRWPTDAQAFASNARAARPRSACPPKTCPPCSCWWGDAGGGSVRGDAGGDRWHRVEGRRATGSARHPRQDITYDPRTSVTVRPVRAMAQGTSRQMTEVF